MAQPLSPKDLHALLQGQVPPALLDVREHGEYNTAHISGASSLPRRLLESHAMRLAPCLSTATVVYDDDGRRAALAATTLERMGYTNVSVLANGLIRWASDGFNTEWGVNVPSKAFGEQVLTSRHVPELTPVELHEWMEKDERFVLLDARTPEEHRQATIPGSRSVPGGELALRITGIVPDPSTTIVVHCAGRTRSIIGAETLRGVGYENVYCLKNGTMGWFMAGFSLDTSSTRVELVPPSPEHVPDLEQQARKEAEKEGVVYLSPEELDALVRLSGQENIYLIDVRTREEYGQGHVPGFTWFPGGQAVQRTDEMVADRQGRIVFTCDGLVRASTTAAWFRRMGLPNIYVLEGGTAAWAGAGRRLETGQAVPEPFGYDAALAQTEFISPKALAQELIEVSTPKLLFVGTSREFMAGHPSGGAWAPRGWLELWAPDLVPMHDSPVVIACEDGVQSVLAGATLQGMGYASVRVLQEGVAAWRDAGLPLETGLSGVMAPPNDVVPTGTERTTAEMLFYLSWEEALGHGEST
jgi:rhodanese-related sulfurtransferase